MTDPLKKLLAKKNGPDHAVMVVDFAARTLLLRHMESHNPSPLDVGAVFLEKMIGRPTSLKDIAVRYCVPGTTPFYRYFTQDEVRGILRETPTPEEARRLVAPDTGADILCMCSRTDDEATFAVLRFARSIGIGDLGSPYSKVVALVRRYLQDWLGCTSSEPKAAQVFRAVFHLYMADGKHHGAGEIASHLKWPPQRVSAFMRQHDAPGALRKLGMECGMGKSREKWVTLYAPTMEALRLRLNQEISRKK